jgi:hypothetical protein
VTDHTPGSVPAPAGRTVAPLYAAGFVTAFGAHGIAANLGLYTHDRHDCCSVELAVGLHGAG